MDANNLILKKNAQIYIKKSTFNENSTSEIIEAAVKKASAPPLISDQSKVIADQQPEYKFTATVFKTTKSVDFLDYSAQDEVHAYIVTLETDTHLLIIKKNCANIEQVIEKHLEPVPHEKLLSLISTPETEFQRLALRNMTSSDKAIRGRQYEAANLKGLISLHAAGRSIPHTMKVRQGGSIKTLTTSTARIIEQSERQRIEEISRWATDLSTQLNNSGSISDFLSSFAKPVKLTEVLKTSDPISILLEANLMMDIFESKEAVIGRTLQNKAFKELSNKSLTKLFTHIEKCYEIDSKDKIDAPFNATLKRNSKSLTFDSPVLKKLKVFDGTTISTLQAFIIKHRLYSICFTEPKYMYFKGTCFEDVSGISEINSILEIFTPKKELSEAASEKGSLTASQTAFHKSSLFYIVENLHSSDDYIFCDDLGDEWADHITINLKEESINFIHSKHGALSNSASKFHDVVGQGIKNIGNMSFTPEYFQKKLKGTLANNYKDKKISTSIKRIRKGNQINFNKDIKRLISAQNLKRKCILACSFTSKEAVTKELLKIKARKPVKGNIIQLMWIISSFIHATREANIVPIIYCQE
jgi:hypothetical protein